MRACVRAFHTLLRCRAWVALPPSQVSRRHGSHQRLAAKARLTRSWTGRAGWLDGYGGMGRQVLMVARDPHGPALVDDALEIKMALPFMLNGLRAKGSADALINSKNSMWPVAEFSRFRMYSPIWYRRAPLSIFIIEMFRKKSGS